MKIDRSNVFPGLLSNEITRGSIVPLSRPRQMLEIHPLNKIYRLDYPAFLTCAKAVTLTRRNVSVQLSQRGTRKFASFCTILQWKKNRGNTCIHEYVYKCNMRRKRILTHDCFEIKEKKEKECVFQSCQYEARICNKL